MEKLESIIFLGNPLNEWLIALAYILGGVILSRIVYRIFKNRVRKWTEGTNTQIDDVIVDAVEEPLSIFIVISGFWLGYAHLKFGNEIDNFMFEVFEVAMLLNFTWLCARAVNSLLGHVFSKMASSNKDYVVNDMAPILQRTVGFGIWSLGVITAMNNAGFDVGALIAGVGIGGIAMAMAAKDFVANIFGGITVFIDRPFRVGDRIKINGIDGAVAEIGIRSTRITTLEGRTVTIPNNQFTNTVVENVSAEPSRKVVITLGLTYDATPEMMQQAMETLKQIIGDHPNTENDYTVYFSSFGDFSLNITCSYFIRKTGHWANTPSEINLSILQKFNELNLDFAFPTQTVYVNK